MIKEIINNIETLAMSHLMIKSVDRGNSFNIQKTEALYPQFYLEYPFNIVYSKATKQVSFSFYIVDLPSEGYTDDVDLLNKVEQINEDLILRMQLQDYNYYHTLTGINSITFTEWEGDNTIAIRTDVTINVDRNSDNCEAPFN